MATSREPMSGVFTEGVDIGSPRLKEIPKNKICLIGRGRKVKKDVMITVIEGHCKGHLCRICIDLCPTHVLTMGASIVEVVDIDACTKCMLCEVRCPDFAIFVD
jgi:2-oxoglutarate ferredoxin oxidoreductase subunit delta